jgi:hypothetical protein
MKRPYSFFILFLIPSISQAELIIWDVPDLLTPPVWDPNGETDPNEFSTVGVWLQMTTGATIINEDETAFPAFVDGQYQLRMNNAYATTAAQIVIQGLIVDGNSLLGRNGVPNVADGNIARLAPGDLVDPDTYIDAAYTDLAGLFGLWNDLGRGQAGVRFPTEDRTGYHYGFIDMTINEDKSIILHGFAYDDTPDTAVEVFEIGDDEGVAVTPWASIEPILGTVWKETSMGLMADREFPFVYSEFFEEFLYVDAQLSTATEILAYQMKSQKWIWLSEDTYPLKMWYDFDIQDWAAYLTLD